MIAYLYPPLENAGTRRAVKFVKYLPEFGYHPVILTTQTRGSLPDDAQTLTYRTDDLLGIIKRAYRAVKLRHVPAEKRANIGLLAPEGRLERWKAAYLLPDPEIIWYPLAVQKGRQIVRSLPVCLLYSTSSPETDHLVALKLKRETGLPWVADFRDGWMFEPLRPQRLSSPLRNRIESGLEQKVMLNADRIITVNQVIADDMKRRYPAAAAKVSVISNGYDPDDYAGLRRQATSEKFRLVHTGSLSLSRGTRSIAGLLKALQEMSAANMTLMQQLEIVLVGKLTEQELTAIEQSGVHRYFCLTGQVPYQQALQYQLDADVLLLVTAPQDGCDATSKLHEYLATGRPILALASQSATTELITLMDAGLIVGPDNPAEIKQAFQTFYTKWQQQQLPSQISDHVSQFDRRELTRKLAAFFDELVYK